MKTQFGLLWGMTCDKVKENIRLGDGLDSIYYLPICEVTRCDSLKKAEFVADFVNSIKWHDLYFWNDSLFIISFFLC